MKKIFEKFLYRYISKTRNSIKVALVYPNSYYVGMSNLGFQIVYHYLNVEEEILISRFFFSNSSDNNVFSPDKKFNLKDADIILLSQSFELDLLNFIKILINNNINIYKYKRDDNSPIIGAGGIFPSINPNIYNDIVDIVYHGEIEFYLSFFINSILNIKEYDRVEFINYVNEYLSKIRNNDAFPTIDINQNSVPAHSVIITNQTSFNDMFLIEISRGCKYNCAFCLVTNIYKNFRFYDKSQIISLVKKAIKHTNKIGLISALTTEHPELLQIVNEINDLGGIVSFSSLRIDKINDDLLVLMQRNNQKTLTIAVETASEKLKAKISKQISNDKIFNLLENSLNYGFKKVKLYFIIGFKEEDIKDIDENIMLIKKIRELLIKKSKSIGYLPKIIISISPLIPKPYTKFSNINIFNIKEINYKLNYIKKKLYKLGGIEIHIESPVLSLVQSIISNGNKDTGELLIKLGKEGRSIRRLIKLIS